MKTLKDIHQDLSLSHPPDQDWGLVNGETGRTKGFIEYFNSNEQFIDKPTRLSYLDLVISSYNQSGTPICGTQLHNHSISYK